MPSGYAGRMLVSDAQGGSIRQLCDCQYEGHAVVVHTSMQIRSLAMLSSGQIPVQQAIRGRAVCLPMTRNMTLRSAVNSPMLAVPASTDQPAAFFDAKCGSEDELNPNLGICSMPAAKPSAPQRYPPVRSDIVPVLAKPDSGSGSATDRRDKRPLLESDFPYHAS